MPSAPLIFRLLPELYRSRDAGGALEALAGLLDEPRDLVERDIARMYRNWFVETCEPWVLPYLARLAGADGPPAAAADPRALVADAIALACRKGTRPALELRLARLTGWPSLVSDAERGEVRARMWPDPVHPVSRAAPASLGEGRYRFHPLGVDCPLFAPPRPFPGIGVPFDPAIDAPVRLDMEASPGELERAVSIFVENEAGAFEAIQAADMRVADLGEWRSSFGDDTRVLVDPSRGRFRLKEGAAEDRRVEVAFAYAAPGNVGGGPYERAMIRPHQGAWVAYVHADAVSDPAAIVFRGIGEAVEAFRDVPGDGLIRILDSGHYRVEGLDLGQPPRVCAVDPDAPRRLTIEALSGEAPVLLGHLGATGRGPGFALLLRGLWIDGRLTLEGRVEARIEHCTLHPARDADALRSRPHEGEVPKLILDACVTGRLDLAGGTRLEISDSVVDSRSKNAVRGRASATLVRATLLGGAEFESVDALDTLFGEAIAVARPELSRLRFCASPGADELGCAQDCISDRSAWTFRSLSFAAPGYARLLQPQSGALRTAASNGSEIGLFNGEFGEARERLAKDALETDLPIGIGYRLDLG